MCYGHRKVSVGRSHIVRMWWEHTSQRIHFFYVHRRVYVV